MAQGVSRYCAVPRCPNRCVTGSGFCEQHGKARTREYESARGTSTHRGYGTQRWRDYRVQFLMDNPLCVRCGQPATVVDHVIPVRVAEKQGIDFYDSNFHAAMCHACHNAKTREDEKKYK